MKVILLVFVFASLSFARVNEWAARSGFQLMSINSSAKRTAMGGVGAAVPSKFSLFSNPANYGSEANYRMSFEHLWRITYSDLNVNRFELFVPVRSTFLAISAQNHTVSNIFIRDMFPGSPPRPGDLSADWQFSQISATVGINRTPTFDWAISAGFVFDRFLDEIAYGFVMNAGFLWKFLNDDLRVGLAFNNFGVTTPMINEDGRGERWGDGERLPTNIRGGVLYSANIRNLRYRVAADLLYWHLFDPQEGRTPNFARRIQIPLGLEILPVDFLAIRVGKTILADYNVFNFGFGVETQVIGFDISTAINRYETNVELEWIAGVTLNFGARR